MLELTIVNQGARKSGVQSGVAWINGSRLELWKVASHLDESTIVIVTGSDWTSISGGES